MLEKQSSPYISPMVAPIESDFSLDETDTNVFKFEKQIPDVFNSPSIPSGLESLWSTGKDEMLDLNVDFGSRSLVTAVKNLIDIIRISETHLFASLTERDYQELVTILDDLIDVIGENESHILASVMDFIGTLIENYEDRHVPELTII